MARARSQKEHAEINSREYPGTRQLCEVCGEPTGRCEEDAYYSDEGIGPLCEACYHADEDGCPDCGADTDGDYCGECKAVRHRDAEADAADAVRRMEREKR